MSWMPKRAPHYVIRVYYRGVRAAYYVKVQRGRWRVEKGWRGAQRFERERDGLWIVITNQWYGNPIVESAE